MTFLASILKSNEDLSLLKLSRDNFGIFTVVEERRRDSSLFKRSVLTGTGPYYNTRTVTTYDTDGTTVVNTLVYTITWVNGELVSEVLQ